MALAIPRVTLRISLEDEYAFGEFGSISFGYGLHQSWVYATMFATRTLFSDDLVYAGPFGESICITAFLSMLVFGITLIVSSLLDQKVAPFLQKRSTAICAAAFMCIGTLIMLIDDGQPLYINAFDIVPGLLTGLGSAVLILAWGCRFARVDVVGIAINTALAICLGFFIYSAILAPLPYPIGGIVTACVPLIELGVLLGDRKAYGLLPLGDRVFRPLPIGKLAFFWRFGVPVFIFGLALGIMRRNSVQSVLNAENVVSQSTLIAAAGLAFIVFLLIIIANVRNSSIRRHFRILVPIIALAILMIPSLSAEGAYLQTLYTLAAYMCFEALMWAFFAEIAQRYRLSPILTFGCGRGLLALASVLGAIITLMSTSLIDALPFGDESVLIAMLVVMVCAYAVLPSDKEIAQIVKHEGTISRQGVDSSALIDPLDLKAQELSRARERSTAQGTQAAQTSQAEENAKEEASPAVEPGNTSGLAASSESLSPAGRANAGAQGSPATISPVAMQQQAAAQVAAESNSSPLIEASTSVSTPQLTKEEEAVARERANKGWFRARCEKVANTYLLSERESEVMFYLAKGYNAAYIQEKLYISEGTAKTHMRHIYRKLDIHSQQELMRMVENADVERPVYR